MKTLRLALGVTVNLLGLAVLAHHCGVLLR